MIEISLIKPPTPKRKSSVIKKLILISLLGLALWLFFVEHQDSRFMEKEGFSIQHLRSFLNREDISKQKIRAFLEKTGSFMSANGEKPSKRPSVSSAVKVLVQPVVIKPNNRVFEASNTRLLGLITTGWTRTLTAELTDGRLEGFSPFALINDPVFSRKARIFCLEISSRFRKERKCWMEKPSFSINRLS